MGYWGDSTALVGSSSLRAPVWVTILTGSDLALVHMVALIQLKFIIIILHRVEYCKVRD
jgi:hypothetical protein